MSLLTATQVTAVATAVLAFFAMATAVFAYLAFRKQSTEVNTLQEQFSDQRTVNAKQVAVLGLQAEELNASLKERQLEVGERQRSQAAKVTAWLGLAGGLETALRRGSEFYDWGAVIRNASDLPVLNVSVFFHFVDEQEPGEDWEPEPRGEPVEKILIVPPEADRFVAIPRSVSHHADDSTCVVSIEFTDAAGQRWERDPRGALLPRS
jgi:hypothetical protein